MHAVASSSVANSSVARSSVAGRIGAVACGSSLAAAAALVAINDPSAAGSRFPVCSFNAVTGLWCPGCGLTRGTHHLLRGDIAAAMSSNLFTPFALAAIISAWLVWITTAFGRPIRNPVLRWPSWVGPTLLILVVTYGVVRNLPVPALSTLAP